MSLELVSLTGADDHVAPEVLAALSAKYPFAEWAILYFPEKDGTQRNPSAPWREKFLALDLPYTAAHLCGTRVFHALLDPELAHSVISDLSRYRRIQLNINARRPEFTAEEVLAIYRTLHGAGLRLILQHHAGSERVIEQFLYELDEEGMKRVDILFDASKGTGQRPDNWPAPHRFNLFCGYAGGLGPDVLETELPKIKAAIAQAQSRRDLPYWIDMESGIRTENAFDLEKVEQVLAYCHSGDIDHLSRCLLIQTTQRDIPEGLYSMSLTWEQIKILIQAAMDEGARRNVKTHAVWNNGGGEVPTTATVGAFIDLVAGQRRTPAAVAGRLTEEVVELALAAGLSAGQVMGHVADALHNQSLKATETQAKTVFPSQLSGDKGELAEECADVSLVLKDLCHVAHVDLPGEEADKWDRFTKKQFRVGPSGTIYAVKPHIKD
ncbi:hypothetical protein [Azonexus hydrophilus]|uniref:Uncharacterized protein n=1 Tax=Azonexus hydrophilus TaxID=418702 RepID=A0ABZ2XLD6_9RHOO